MNFPRTYPPSLIAMLISQTLQASFTFFDYSELMVTYAFIDASNLFYGGEKSLGWKIDYQKFIEYLRKKYEVSRVLYFGGIETYDFKYDYLIEDFVPLERFASHLLGLSGKIIADPDSPRNASLEPHLKRIRFYLKLRDFGYEMILKPMKRYRQENGPLRRKANCDVDMAFRMMKEKDTFDCAIFLSGDGDFLPVLKYLKNLGKKVIVLGRGSRTAKEIRQFAGSEFRDFEYLREKIRIIDPDEIKQKAPI